MNISKDKCQKWGGKPLQWKIKVFVRIHYTCRLITRISQVSVIDGLPLCKCIFHLLSILSQAWGPERETASFTSAQAPGVLSRQSGQRVVKSARVPAWYCHKRELERFCVVTSLGQGVSSISVSQQFLCIKTKYTLPSNPSFSENKSGTILIFNASWGLAVPIRANRFSTLPDNMFKNKTLKSLA